MHLPLANLLGLDVGNWTLIALMALLLFGKRLPEVGRSLGKGIIEFKKGLAGIEEDVNQPLPQQPAERAALPPKSGTEYKFDPYTGKPLAPEQPATAQMRFDPYTGKPLDEHSTSTNV